jgi:hypothetical protein
VYRDLGFAMRFTYQNKGGTKSPLASIISSRADLRRGA